ncbi:MAG: hypothetical protein U9Q03_01100 [Patescibacteria group bacterium]|nr:hypothetical protein [Patescibacteria group bacterium]
MSRKKAKKKAAKKATGKGMNTDRTRTRAFRYALLAIAVIVTAVCAGTCLTSCIDSGEFTTHYISLGGDIDASNADEMEYGDDEPWGAEPESRSESPFSIARQCGRRYCRIAMIDRSIVKRVSGPEPAFAGNVL